MDESKARGAFEEALQTYRQEFGQFFLARLFGLEISYADGACVVDVPVNDFMYNPQGSLHGGIIALILDISMGHLIHHTIGKPAVTLEMKVQYMRPAIAGRVSARGMFLKQGRSVSYMESRLTDAEGKLLAAATATWHMPKV